MSAARLHGALPQALSTALVPAPRQHEIVLLDRPASVRFVKRDTASLDVETVSSTITPPNSVNFSLRPPP